MGFNLMAALGGAGTAVSQNIQEGRLQMDKIELMDAEAATRERLARSAEKREQDKENDRIAEGLSYYLTDEEVAVAMKRGIGSAKELLNKAQNFDGDFGAAFNLPELKSAPYGEDLLNIETEKLNAVKQAEVSRLTDPLSTFITEEPEPDDLANTHAEFELNWGYDKEKIVKSGKPQSEIDAALAEHDKKWAQYLLRVEEVADAKRKGDEGTKTKPDYTDAALNTQYEKALDIAFAYHTGLAGDRKLLTEQRGGSNAYAVSSVFATMDMHNLNNMNGKIVSQQKQDYINTRVKQGVAEVNRAAKEKYFDFKNRLIDFREKLRVIDANGDLSPQNKEEQKNELMSKGAAALNYQSLSDNPPSGILTNTEFLEKQKQGSLRKGGIYLVKTQTENGTKISVVTTFNTKIPDFGEGVVSASGQTYVGAFETGILDQSLLDLFDPKFLKFRNTN